jgi:hypothetical protein
LSKREKSGSLRSSRESAPRAEIGGGETLGTKNYFCTRYKNLQNSFKFYALFRFLTLFFYCKNMSVNLGVFYHVMRGAHASLKIFFIKFLYPVKIFCTRFNFLYPVKVFVPSVSYPRISGVGKLTPKSRVKLSRYFWSSMLS